MLARVVLTGLRVAVPAIGAVAGLVLILPVARVLLRVALLGMRLLGRELLRGILLRRILLGGLLSRLLLGGLVLSRGIVLAAV